MIPLERYPMGTLAEAERSVRLAALDRVALRITEAELDAVKKQLAIRIAAIKKQALLATVARVITRTARDDHGEGEGVRGLRRFGRLPVVRRDRAQGRQGRR